MGLTYSYFTKRDFCIHTISKSCPNFCPTLKNEIGDSKVPEGIGAIPEIVIDGISLKAVKNAMKVGIESVFDMEGVKRISAGNYGGTLGQVKLELREIVPTLFE